MWRRLAWPDRGNQRSAVTRRSWRLTLDPSSVVVRSVSALGLAGGALATALVLQGPPAEGHSDTTVGTRLVTSTGAVDVGTPSVALTHQANEMVGMPASAAHRTGGEVLVPVTLTNTSDQSIRYAASQFHLIVDGETVEAAGEAADDPGRELRPNAAVSLRLTFPHVSLVHGGQLSYLPAAGAPLTAPLDAVSEAEHSPAGGSAVNGVGSTSHEHKAH